MTHNRRPQSRLSKANLSTTATMSFIPTPSSRPATPTFLPIPISHLGVTGYRKSTGPGTDPLGGSYSQPKCSSIGSSNAGSPTPSLDSEFHPRERPFSYNGKVQKDLKSPQVLDSLFIPLKYLLLPPSQFGGRPGLEVNSRHSPHSPTISKQPTTMASLQRALAST
ncbi:hypothetical protein EV702DRAFT_1221100 [Suillus placidus]|uniref:Uncharacterized protein n=1 Tax=Suillus placidus TaxID=48579 RepID=A0A9P6ZFM2_9AGAM|nr:hypothetical protein EV702DRAFT_1221100 [Suillus placidus]